MVLGVGTRIVTIYATLEDNTNNAIPGEPVYLYYRQSGTSNWLDIGTNPRTTDSDGNVSGSITLTVPGTYDFRAVFNGDQYYEASSAELNNQLIKSRTKIILTFNVTS